MHNRWRRRLAASVTGLVALALVPMATLAPGSVAGAADGHSVGPSASDNFWLTTPAGSVYGFGVASYGLAGITPQPAAGGRDGHR